MFHSIHFRESILFFFWCRFISINRLALVHKANTTSQVFIPEVNSPLHGFFKAKLEIPQFEKDYKKSHATVSLLFVGNVIGAVVAAAVADKTHSSLGRRGAGAIASLCMALGSIFLALRPPWPVVPVAICLVSYGVAGLDPAASAWVGSLHHASGFLGMLQGCFGIGSTIAPLIAHAVAQRGIPYYQYYYIPVGL